MDKVNEILSDPESLKQIQELANMLNSEMENSQTTQDTQNTNTSPMNNFFDSTSNSSTDNPQNSNAMPNIDFSKIFQLIQMFNSTSNSKDTALLLAIKPYLTSERQSKVDKAIKLMKIYDIFTTANSSGLLNGLDTLI